LLAYESCSCKRRYVMFCVVQVSERALFFWHNEYVSSLIADYRDSVLPVIFPLLHENAEKHWNTTVSNLAGNVLKIFEELDKELLRECEKKYEEQQRKKSAYVKQRAEKWHMIEQMANKRHAASSNSS